MAVPPVPQHPINAQAAADTSELPSLSPSVGQQEPVAALFADRPDAGLPGAPTTTGLLLLINAGSSIWNQWRNTYPEIGVNFCDLDFASDAIDFSGFDFRGQEGVSSWFRAEISFAHARFPNGTSFQGAHFGSRARFSEAVFGDAAVFDDAVFGASPSFAGAKFGSDASFQRTNLALFANFEEAEFGKRASFDAAVFLGTYEGPNFSRAKFADGVSFVGTLFRSGAHFSSAVFDGDTSFVACRFGATVQFAGTLFAGEASFDGAHFSNRANFESASFLSSSSFVGAHFSKFANFRATTFQGLATFVLSEFHGTADFSAGDALAPLRSQLPAASSPVPLVREMPAVNFSGAAFFGDAIFRDRRFLGPTSFSATSSKERVLIARSDNWLHPSTPFRQASDLKPPTSSAFFGCPIFHGATLNQDTSFDHAIFGTAPSADLLRAYRTLKLAMAQQHAFREELRFFHLEMWVEGQLSSGGKAFLFSLYRLASNYGFSLARPLILWLASLVVATLMYGAIQGATLSIHVDWELTGKLTVYTLATGLPLPGLDKLSADLRPNLFAHSFIVESILLTLNVVQKAVFFATAFLVGLALRNTFRLRT
jgi:uncharacterized protein YjbI with pentapeptide repeats